MDNARKIDVSRNYLSYDSGKIHQKDPNVNNAVVVYYQSGVDVTYSFDDFLSLNDEEKMSFVEQLHGVRQFVFGLRVHCVEQPACVHQFVTAQGINMNIVTISQLSEEQIVPPFRQMVVQHGAVA